MVVDNNHNATLTSPNTTPPSPLCDITNKSSTQASSATTQVPLQHLLSTPVTTRLRNKRLVKLSIWIICPTKGLKFPPQVIL
jgi:hypothetical protein